MAAMWRENDLRKVCFFKVIRHSYNTLVRKKKTQHSREQGNVRIGRTDYLIILVRKFTALTAAGFRENKLKK